MGERCVFDWPDCPRLPVDVAIMLNPNWPPMPACHPHLLVMVDPVGAGDG